MEKKLHFTLLIFVQFFVLGSAVAFNKPIAEGKNTIKSLSCDAPAPDSFRITNTGASSISLAWKPAWEGATHTLKVLEQLDGEVWEPIDTILDLPGKAYTVTKLKFGSKYQFIIATNCPSGETSVHTAGIDGIVFILELVLSGRTPENPQAVQECIPINYLAHNWVGFKVELAGGTSSPTQFNYFEFGTREEGGEPIPLVKRTVYGPSLVAGDFQNNYPINPFPTIIEIQGVNNFNIFLVKGINIQQIGNLTLEFNSAAHTFKICKSSWNDKYSFNVLVAESAFLLPIGNNDRNFNDLFDLGSIKVENPFNDVLNVFLPQSQELPEGGTVSLINSIGQEVLRKKLAFFPNQFCLPVESLTPGVYIFRIETEGNIKTFKVLKSE